jgi:uncharacterized protein (TIGR02996 family)
MKDEYVEGMLEDLTSRIGSPVELSEDQLEVLQHYLKHYFQMSIQLKPEWAHLQGWIVDANAPFHRTFHNDSDWLDEHDQMDVTADKPVITITIERSLGKRRDKAVFDAYCLHQLVVAVQDGGMTIDLEDQTARLILADWLDEHDQGDVAAWVRSRLGGVVYEYYIHSIRNVPNAKMRCGYVTEKTLIETFTNQRDRDLAIGVMRRRRDGKRYSASRKRILK